MTAALTLVVCMLATAVYIQVMGRRVRRGEDQGKYQHKSNETVPFCVPVKCFRQHTVIVYGYISAFNPRNGLVTTWCIGVPQPLHGQRLASVR